MAATEVSRAIVPVSPDFPVWVASQCGDLEALADFVLGGHARSVGLQFFHYRPGAAVRPVDFHTFKDGLLVHALVAVDHAGRRVAAGEGDVPYGWTHPNRAVGVWDAVRRNASISGFVIPVLEGWKH